MSKKRILIIEDDSNIRESTHEILELSGFESFQACDGQEGIDQARKHFPHLILCDIMMPKIDGYDVLRELRKDPLTAVIQFIFFTAKTEKHDIRNGMALGADDYLLKPVDPEELITAIKSRLARQEAFGQRIEDLHSSLSRMVPHEFRTPLNGILGFSQIITMKVRGQNDMSDEELLEYVSMIENSGQRLLRLVETYTLFTEVTTNFATGSLASNDSQKSTWMTSLAESVQEVAHRYQREEDFHATMANSRLPVSSYFLEKAVCQLTDNAFKFSKPGTPVYLKGFIDGANAVFSITDSGRGMTSEEISRIGPFVQFDRNKFEQQGSGLGLAVVQKIAQILKGSIVIESSPGNGTVVRLTVPVAG
ncbi:MAG: response regulator [Candidatus Ozemobacteraceae bacterium]